MSEYLKFTFFDIIRWIIALILLPFIFWCLFWSLNLPFEFANSYICRLNLLLFIIVWAVISPIFITFCMMVGKLMPLFSTMLVKQVALYIMLFNLCLFVFMIYVLYMVWSDSYVLGWELFRYDTINRIIFSIFLLIYVVSLFTNLMEVDVMADDLKK